MTRRAFRNILVKIHQKLLLQKYEINKIRAIVMMIKSCYSLEKSPFHRQYYLTFTRLQSFA